MVAEVAEAFETECQTPVILDDDRIDGDQLNGRVVAVVGRINVADLAEQRVVDVAVLPNIENELTGNASDSLTDGVMIKGMGKIDMPSPTLRLKVNWVKFFIMKVSSGMYSLAPGAGPAGLSASGPLFMV